MIAKKHPRSDAVHVNETRKVDSMNEVVASLMLDADATLPPPKADPSPASLSAVRYSPQRLSYRPSPNDHEIPQFRPRYARGIVIALLVALALVGGVAIVLFNT